MLEAPFRLARAAAARHVRRAAGAGSCTSPRVHGHRASPYKSAYVSAKHGLEGLSKVIALEAAGKGVTSNTVCPGYVRTPLVEGQIADQAAQPRHRRGRGPRRGPARPHAGEAARRARGGGRPGRLPLRPRHRLDHRQLVPHRRRLDRRLTDHAKGATPCPHSSTRVHRGRHRDRAAARANSIVEGRLRQPDRHRRSSGTTSSSTARPPRWSSARCSSRSRTRSPRRCWPSAPTRSASSPGPSAASSSATSVTGSAARRCSSSR